MSIVMTLTWYVYYPCSSGKKGFSAVSSYLLIIYNSNISRGIEAMYLIYNGVIWGVSWMRNILGRMTVIWSNLSTSKVLYQVCVKPNTTGEVPRKSQKLCSRLWRFNGEVFYILHAVQLGRGSTMNVSLMHAKTANNLEQTKVVMDVTM